MSRTLEALKRAEAQRFARPTGSRLGLGPQARPETPPGTPAPGGLLVKAWIGVAVLAIVAALCGWWAFGPTLTVKVGQGAAAPAHA